MKLAAGVIAAALVTVTTGCATFNRPVSGRPVAARNVLSEQEWVKLVNDLGYDYRANDVAVYLSATGRADDGRWAAWILVGDCVGELHQKDRTSTVVVFDRLGGQTQTVLGSFEKQLGNLENLPAETLASAFQDPEVKKAIDCF